MDDTSRPSSKADMVPMSPTPSFTRSRVSASRWCFGNSVRKAILASAPANTQQRITAEISIGVMCQLSRARTVDAPG